MLEYIVGNTFAPTRDFDGTEGIVPEVFGAGDPSVIAEGCFCFCRIKKVRAARNRCKALKCGPPASKIVRWRTKLKETMRGIQVFFHEGGFKSARWKMKQPLGLISGMGMLLLSTGASWAAPAVVSTDLNVRSGEGTGYSVTAVMPQGTIVDVTGCGDGWCYVRDYGGFASAGYLDIGRTAYRTRPDIYTYGPAYRSYAYAPTYRPSFSFGIGYGRGLNPWWGW